MKKILKIIVIVVMLLLAVGVGGWLYYTNSTKNPIDEYAFDSPLKKWSAERVQIAAALYPDFVPCSVKIDDEWYKALYNKEHDLTIVQSSKADEYQIYQGKEMLSIQAGRVFPDDLHVRIRLEELGKKDVLYIYIDETQDGSGVAYVIGVNPLKQLNTSYTKSDIDSMLREVCSDDISDETLKKYTLANNYYKYEETLEKLEYNVWWRTGVTDGEKREYLHVSISFYYDEDTNSYQKSDDADIEYLLLNPADWG